MNSQEYYLQFWGDWLKVISIADYLLLPLYIIIVYSIAINFRNKKYPLGHPWRPYFVPALTYKIIGAIAIGMIYQYHYGSGDTILYFKYGQIINSSMSESFVKWLNLILHMPSVNDGAYIDYTSRLEWYTALNNYAVCSIAAIAEILSFNTFLPACVLFAFLSFSGIWALFRTFAIQYPNILKYVALATLFIPSTIIWGSGIFKDTICQFGLGWLTYAVFRLLIQRKVDLRSLTISIFGFILLGIVKIYILLAFIPALSLWIIFSYSNKIKSGFTRVIITVSFAGGCIIGLVLFSSKFSEQLGQYSLQNIQQTSLSTQYNITELSKNTEGASYSLGSIDPSLAGMLEKLPLAINVTLFRPYVWEVRSVLPLLNSLEALIFLFITLKIIFTLGVTKIWNAISKDPNIQFFLIFTIIFAFAVGISSGNFGALSRYRIPCLPFYGMALILIYYKYNPSNKNILSIS